MYFSGELAFVSKNENFILNFIVLNSMISEYSVIFLLLLKSFQNFLKANYPSGFKLTKKAQHSYKDLANDLGKCVNHLFTALNTSTAE